MKWTVKKEDLVNYAQKYGNDGAVAGYLEDYKLFKISLPSFYIAVIDEEKITIIQLNLKMEPKKTTEIPKKDIRSLKISNGINPVITLETASEKKKYLLKTTLLFIRENQKTFLTALQAFSEQ